MGYEIFVSVDLDEYLLPGSSSKTVMDELVEWFTITTRGVVAISKYQFSPVPHILGSIISYNDNNLMMMDVSNLVD